jgi:hypothetical protein
MPSFDIVSEIDMQEVRNAVENATRDLANRASRLPAFLIFRLSSCWTSCALPC